MKYLKSIALSLMIIGCTTGNTTAQKPSLLNDGYYWEYRNFR